MRGSSRRCATLSSPSRTPPPEGVEIDELEAMVRRVVAEELGPVRETLGQLEALATGPGPAGKGPVTLTRERMRHRRSR
jgi:hypothetical protein